MLEDAVESVISFASKFHVEALYRIAQPQIPDPADPFRQQRLPSGHGVIPDTFGPEEAPMPKAAELAELHHLIGNMRRCVTALQDRYGDAPAMRRVMIDTDRILGDLEILEMDAGELSTPRTSWWPPARRSRCPTPLRPRVLAGHRRRGRRRAQPRLTRL